MDGAAHRGHELLLEPGMVCEPAVVVPRRVRDRKEPWGKIAPRLHSGREGFLAALAQVKSVRIPSRDNSNLKPRHCIDQTGMPGLLTDRGRRQIAIGTTPGIAKGLRNDRDLGLVIEFGIGEV